jgi:hypothetical protein
MFQREVVGKLSPGRAVEQMQEVFFKVWAVLTAVFYFFVEPNSAFMAVWVAFGLSILTKWFEISAKSGGLWPAIRDGKINKTDALKKGVPTVVAYFVLCSLAKWSKNVVPFEQAQILVSSILYAWMFLIEVANNLRHLVGAGVTELKPLLGRFERERSKLEKGGDT